MTVLEQPTEGGQIEITIDTDSLANILSDDVRYVHMYISQISSYYILLMNQSYQSRCTSFLALILCIPIPHSLAASW